MKTIHVLLLALACILPVHGQTKTDSVRLDVTKLTQLIEQCKDHPTPEVDTYFRSLRPVAKDCWAKVKRIDSTQNALSLNPETQEEAMAYARKHGMELSTYLVLLEAVLFSYQDTILHHPQIQASLTQAREAIRKGADTTEAWKIVQQGLETLPRYENHGSFNAPDGRRLEYEFCALNNMLGKWCAQEFDKLINKRDGNDEQKTTQLKEQARTEK